MTGVLLERLPPGKECKRGAVDEAALAVYLEAIWQAQDMDRQFVRTTAASDFATAGLIANIVSALEMVRG